MAYAAVTSLVNALLIWNLEDPRISKPPIHTLSILEEIKHLQDKLKILEATNKVLEELKNLQAILKRLDATSKASSRKKVNALDADIKDAVWRFHDLFESRLYHHLLLHSHSDQILDPEASLQDFDSFSDLIEDKQDEYLALLDDLNLLPEEEDDDDEAATSATPTETAGGRGKFKTVGDSRDMLSELIGIRMDSSGPVDVVPIVGMAGIGKTAVAREYFDDPELESEFDCRAWVSVGRKPPPIHTIKRDILTQLDPASKDRKKIRERDVEHLLKGIFKAKRCLLVLDDVWDTLVWDELEILFPDYGGGNDLVLITSRLRHLGVEVDQSWSRTSHLVQLLYEDESWDLLRQRVFGEEEECPPEFIKPGQKIADICDGLPLMINTVAALLLEAEMTPEFWEEVAEKEAEHPIFTAAYDQLYEVLLPSYEYLPQHLKPCFLHMGVFPRFYEINRGKFLNLWLNEGFLDPTMADSFHLYLRELMDHSVAMVCQTSSTLGGIKSCRLHSTFWHLCRREATATKFCRVLTSRDDGLQQDSMKGQRRLSFHNNILFAMKDLITSLEEACASSARSLFLYGSCHPYPVPICSGLRLLKLLDVLFLRFYEFPVQVIQLVYLKYLALTCNTGLPPSISRLWDLRYLSIQRYGMINFSGETPRVPVEIWYMKRLEYMEIQGWNLPNPPPRGGDGDGGTSSSSLERLLTLRSVGTETCTKEVLERIPNLSKLGILIQSHPNGGDMERVSDHLSNICLLAKLQSLKCIVVNPVLVMGKDIVPPASMFPSSLTKLLLSGTGYPWEYMSIIGSLPNLQVLKLGCYAFRGPKWVVKYGEFRALGHLQIEGTDLVHFEVEDRGLFSLRNFHIGNCYKLKHLVWKPDLSYPIVMAIFDCSPAAATFANEMRSRYESHFQLQDKFQVGVGSSWE